MDYSISIKELVLRDQIRNDQSTELLNKMTDVEIKQYEDEISVILKKDNTSEKYPDWNAAVLAKMIDRDILYSMFKEKLDLLK